MFPVRRQPLVAIEIIMAAKEEVRLSGINSQLRKAVRAKMHVTFTPGDCNSCPECNQKSLLSDFNQVWCQHLQDPVVPGKGHNATPSPSAGQLPPGLLQLAFSCTPLRRNRRGVPCFQSTQILPCDLHWLPVTACIRFKLMVLAFKAVKRTAPIYLQTLVKPPSCTTIAESKQMASLLCSGASVAEWTTDQCQNDRVTRHLLTCSDFTSTLHSVTPSHPQKIVTCH